MDPHPRRRTCTALILLGAALFVATPASAATTSRLAVILEEPLSQKHDHLVLIAATSAFVDSQRFEVIERSRVDAILKEHEFQTFIGDEAQRLGRLVGADYLALVSYTTREREGFTVYTLRARVVSVSTGQIRTTVDSQRSVIDRFGSPTIEDAGQRLLAEIKAKFPVEGYVIKVEGDEVVVDLGKTDGIKKGDKLDVVRFGEAIIHPVTGEAVPGEERHLAVVRVLTVTDTTSLCKLRKGEAELEVGDRARFKDDGGLF